MLLMFVPPKLYLSTFEINDLNFPNFNMLLIEFQSKLRDTGIRILIIINTYVKGQIYQIFA